MEDSAGREIRDRTGRGFGCASGGSIVKGSREVLNSRLRCSFRRVSDGVLRPRLGLLLDAIHGVAIRLLRAFTRVVYLREVVAARKIFNLHQAPNIRISHQISLIQESQASAHRPRACTDS